MLIIEKEKEDNDILIGGIDEAGRGSIIGPLVVAGVSIRKSNISKLQEIGIKDSKTLTPRDREILFGYIIEVVNSLCIFKIGCTEIDEYVFMNGLNRLEAEAMAAVINIIQADDIYVDSCDVNPERYKNHIQHYVNRSKAKIHSLHHADSLNVVVSAASIIAKIMRDKEIKEIRKDYHSIGSGYPSDKRTMYFIKRWVRKYDCAPHFARKSWRPLKIILEETAKRKIFYSG